LSSRRLTAEEADIVKRWSRRRLTFFWVFLPVAIMTTAFTAFIAVACAFDRQWLLAVLFAVATPMLTAVMYTLRKTTERGTMVRRYRGVFKVRADGRSVSLYVGSTFVEVANASLRRQLVDGERCTVEAVDGMPPLVIAVLG
jgi:small-conductance mechanosensitive channel